MVHLHSLECGWRRIDGLTPRIRSRAPRRQLLSVWASAPSASRPAREDLNLSVLPSALRWLRGKSPRRWPSKNPGRIPPKPPRGWLGRCRLRPPRRPAPRPRGSARCKPGRTGWRSRCRIRAWSCRGCGECTGKKKMRNALRGKTIKH